MRDGDYLHAAHNSVGQIGYGPRGGPGSSGFFYVWSELTPSNYNYSLNNIFYNVTTGVVYEVASGSDLTHSHDHTDVGSDVDMKSNPTVVSWTNYNSDDLTLKNGAPDIDAGTALTVVTSPDGTGTSFTVANPDWFYDGFTLTEGMKIYVGGDNNLTVAAVDYGTRTITVHNMFTWVQGEAVGYAYRGSGPDLGAYEYGDTLLTQAVISNSGNEYVVTTNGDTRFVVFYCDGIPYVTDYSKPYSASIASGVVTAKAYALHAQAISVLNAMVVTDVDSKSIDGPLQFSLYQNYPNPFNAITQISFSVGKYSRTSIRIYDVLGREIAILMNENKPAGSYNVSWDASRMASGIYLCQLRTESYRQTKKMLLLR
jgi:hypothetical protein